MKPADELAAGRITINQYRRAHGITAPPPPGVSAADAALALVQMMGGDSNYSRTPEIETHRRTIARRYDVPVTALAYLDDERDIEDLARMIAARRDRAQQHHRRWSLAFGITLVWALIIGAGLNLPLWLEMPPFLALFGGTLWHLAWYAGFLEHRP